jgi:phosphoribosylaminoimidazole-succinocarboxamide synthase
VFTVECVVRGSFGLAWKEYRERGTLAGEALPKGLLESERLDPPIFSPATKAEEGHDENITIERMRSLIGDSSARELERLAREVYDSGRRIAAERGIIIADTKFEFGRVSGTGGDEGEKVILVDEVLTPDSSRFWPADRYEPGHGQPSFDKQPLRDYLDAEKRAGRWDGNYPPPRLPKDGSTPRARYLDIYRRLTDSHSTLTADIELRAKALHCTAAAVATAGLGSRSRAHGARLRRLSLLLALGRLFLPRQSAPVSVPSMSPPADGNDRMIEDDEPTFIRRAIRLSIFMNVFHVRKCHPVDAP